MAEASIQPEKTHPDVEGRTARYFRWVPAVRRQGTHIGHGGAHCTERAEEAPRARGRAGRHDEPGERARIGVSRGHDRALLETQLKPRKAAGPRPSSLPKKCLYISPTTPQARGPLFESGARGVVAWLRGRMASDLGVAVDMVTPDVMERLKKGEVCVARRARATTNDERRSTIDASSARSFELKAPVGAL